MQIKTKELLDRLTVPAGKRIALRKDYDPGWVPKGITKQEAAFHLSQGVERLATYQDMLYAQNTHALLVVLQALDAAGKDGTIKHVMSGLNPQGCQVYSFKAPSAEELSHDYLWRCARVLPARGRIGIFNRSYYEETLIVRVHPDVLEREQIPPELKDKGIWKRRFAEINAFEKYLTDNGIHVVKIFLNISKEEQRRRFLARIEHPEKNWKFSAADAAERTYWDEYLDAYEDAFNHTSTREAPWYIVPADHKWFAHIAVARIVYARMKTLKLAYPTVSEAQKEELEKARRILEKE
jgi:PPK2 family polyphosphate:nucleotide phosphotransferase